MDATPTPSPTPDVADRCVEVDVLVAGGGPAGLSAALSLGRSRRKVLIVDDRAPRNAPAAATHAFLTRDGTPPEQLLSLGREEVARYGVEQRRARVVAMTHASTSTACR